MKKYKHNNGKKASQRAGFYVALSICLVAVGLAVWSAYTSISDYLGTTDDEYYSSLINATVAVDNNMTGVVETQPPTQAETREKSFALYETSTIPKEVNAEPSTEAQDADTEADLNSLQAVLKVTQSLAHPTDNKSVLKQYSETAVYSKTMKDYRAHTGCDFDAKQGDKVYAMCDGVVTDIRFDELYGVIIEVNSDEFTVCYCGVNSKTEVKMNDQVKLGDVLGTVSEIPCESEDEDHIHIEVRVGKTLIDPLTVISNDE